MPRIPLDETKVRLDLNISERLRARLLRLRTETEADSLTEVIRRAVAAYEVLVAVRDNGRIILRAKDGTERELLVT